MDFRSERAQHNVMDAAANLEKAAEEHEANARHLAEQANAAWKAAADCLIQAEDYRELAVLAATSSVARTPETCPACLSPLGEPLPLARPYAPLPEPETPPTTRDLPAIGGHLAEETGGAM